MQANLDAGNDTSNVTMLEQQPGAVGVTIANMQFPHRRVDAVEALDVIAACDGNLIRAAARLKASPQSILAAVVGDENGHALLSRYLRAFTSFKTFALVGVLSDKLTELISEDELKPSEVAKTFTSLVQGMSTLTEAPAAVSTDPFAALMKALPAEEREALKVLVQSGAGHAMAPVPAGGEANSDADASEGVA